MVDCVSVEKGGRQRIFSSAWYPHIRISDNLLLHIPAILRRALSCRACVNFTVCVAVRQPKCETVLYHAAEKILCRPPFSTLTQPTICTQATPQGKRVFKEGRNRRCLPFLFPRRTAHVPRTPQRAKSLAQKWRTSSPDEILHPVCRPVHRMLRLMRRMLGIPPHRRIEHRAGRYHRNHRACHRSGCNAGNKR